MAEGSGGPIDLLRKAGFQSGDFVWQVSRDVEVTEFNFGSSTYSGSNNWINLHVAWDVIVPSGATGAVYVCDQVTGSVTASASMGFRLQNTTDAETVVEKTGIESNSPDPELGPTTYTPTTTSTPIELRVQYASEDNATQLTSFTSGLYVGFQIP